MKQCNPVASSIQRSEQCADLLIRLLFALLALDVDFTGYIQVPA
jgi:hypothetical protein